MAAATLNGNNFASATHFSDDRKEVGEEAADSTPTRYYGKNASPRFEAFVMTGDKILRLNSKISPNFALLKQSELPEHTEILDSPTYGGPEPQHEVVSKWQHRRRHKVEVERQNSDSFGSSVPNSRSENAISNPTPLSVANTSQAADSTDDDSRASCATVNAMCPSVVHMKLRPIDSNLQSPTSPNSQSEPVSPAKATMVSGNLANHQKPQVLP